MTAAGQTPPTSSSYTTAPLTTAGAAGRPDRRHRLRDGDDHRDTEWVVEVEDVAPDGTSRPLTEGALLGSLRAVDPARVGRRRADYLLPYHPYTQASATPVVPGQVTRYDIEIFPTFATIAAGHCLRVTISTADTPAPDRHRRPVAEPRGRRLHAAAHAGRGVVDRGTPPTSGVTHRPSGGLVGAP